MAGRGADAVSARRQRSHGDFEDGMIRTRHRHVFPPALLLPTLFTRLRIIARGLALAIGFDEEAFETKTLLGETGAQRLLLRL